MDAKTPAHLARNDLDQYRLRNFIEDLGPDELDTHDEAVDFAQVAEILHGNPKAVLFRKAGPDGVELVGNVAAKRTRLARAFGVTPDKLLQEIQRRLKIEPNLPLPSATIGLALGTVKLTSEYVANGVEVSVT